MFRRILQCLETAEIDRVLDRIAVAVQSMIFDPNRQGSPAAGRAESCGDPEPGENDGIEAVGDVAQLGQCLIDFVPELLYDRALLRTIQPIARETQMDSQCDQPLLGGVMEVARDAPAFAVTGG
jgi:hypothetical protein